MINDLTLAQLSLDAYNNSSKDNVIEFSDVKAVITQNSDSMIIAFRGTRINNIADWLRDAIALPIMQINHEKLGLCHAGFLQGAHGLYHKIKPLCDKQPIILTGHSLGGALAVLFAGLLTADLLPPKYVATFEAPRAGSKTLKTLLSDVSGKMYRYGNDPVTEIPLWPFEHPWEPLTKIGAPNVDVFSCHSIKGVISWLEENH